MTARVPRRAVLSGLAAGGVLTAAADPAGATTRTTTGPTSGPTASATSTTSSGLPLRVVLLDLTPSVYAADDPARATVVARARIEHRGSRTLTALTARLVAQRSPVIARSGLDTWARASDRASITRSSASSDDVVVGSGTLTPGASAEVVITLPAASIGAGVGAHLAAVEVSDDSGRVGVARTFLVSAPASVTPTPVTLLLPLVAGRDVSAAGLATAVRERLDPLVEGSADPRVAWALDPALTAAVASVRAAANTPADGAGPDPTASSTPRPSTEEAQRLSGWLDRLAAASAGRDVVGLPFGDPDLQALSRAPGGTDLLQRAEDAATGAFDVLTGASVRTDVAWPADEAADEDLLGFCARAGASTVVLDDRCLPPDRDLTFTPTGRATVELGGSGPVAAVATVDAVVADRTLSAVLADAADPDEVVPVRQRLVAEAATTTLQRPSDPRAQLLVAPRSFAPAAAVLTGLVTDLEDSGWVSWQPLTALLQTTAPDDERTGPQVATATTRAALPVGHVQDVRDRLVAVDDFRSALQTPTPDTTPAGLLSQQRAALALLGVSWRGHAAELPQARAALTRAVQELTSGVSIATGSVRNLAAERSELPITVVNELDVPVLVDLVLRPRSPRVQLAAVPRQTVPARSQQRVAVPVRALANGSVVVEAQLRTPAGSAVGPAVDIRLNVRADVENWISAVVGGGAAGLLVLGVVRAFRRGNRRVDAAEHPVEHPVEEPPGEPTDEGSSAPAEPGKPAQ
ncbi:DUF6049 family protein [Kineococcus sp. LSe6-4]|uniref:DUF6049 family protein n=1 Tax=Kineococcus halophytocola TaxID=3234027 RepID=A0ABV4H7P1_9ACTN